MNKYQKLINQVTKDDMKKSFYRCFLRTNFRKHRRIVRFGMSGLNLQGIKKYRDYNKGLLI